jgi:hypothetical protein
MWGKTNKNLPLLVEGYSEKLAQKHSFMDAKFIKGLF